MRIFNSATSVFALLATTALSATGAQAQVANTTPSNVNILNLLSPFLSLNSTSVGQTTLQANLQQALSTNNNATLSLQQLSISDKSILGSASNNLSSVGLGTYGVAANLAGGLPAQTVDNGITPQQLVGGLGSQLGPIYQKGVSNGTAGPLAGTVNLLVNAYNFASTDLGVAKNYFANGAANNPSVTPAGYVPVPAVAPAGYTLPTANGLPNATNSVYDLAYGVTNTQTNQDSYGDSRPVQVTPAGVNQFDPTSIVGLTTNPSFPSGHTTYAYTDSLLLAMLVPQDYQNMLLRASAYGNSRIVLGVHYPLDIIGSRALASYDLAQAFTNPIYLNNAATTGAAINLPAQFTTAAPQIQSYLSAQCGASVATCSTSAANTANDPYLSSAANQALYVSRLSYGLPTLSLAQAPQEAAPAGGPDASILLAPVYGGSTTAATTIAPNGGIDGKLQTGTIDQIIMNTETNALAAFYGTSLSYWTRIDLYSAAGYLQNVTGTLSLAPTDVVTTNVAVGTGGLLYNNGTITGPTLVNAGGTLSGTGTTGNVTVAAGGTLAPGVAAAPGTTTVNGTLSFAPGSFYNVRITPNANDSTIVKGTAALGGTVDLTIAPGVYRPMQQYTIIDANALTGAFAAIAPTNLAFLSASISYGDPSAILTLQALPFSTVAQTSNQRDVGQGLTNGSLLPLGASGSSIVGGLQQLTTAQGQAALNGLSGEGITAAQNAAHRSVSEFTSAIMDETTFYGAGQGATNSITLTDGLPSGVLGYAAPVHELADVPAMIRRPVAPIEPSRTWHAWAMGFGGAEDIHGDAGLGSAGQTSTIVGGTLGVDYQLMPQFLAGIAVGGSDGEFDVAGRSTSGSTTGGHVAFYDLATFGPFYGASTDSVSFFGNKTSRTVAGFAGVPGETDRGTFDSHEFRTRLEFGRHVDGFGGVVTPFVALEIAELRSNGFSETNLAGPTLLGLNVQGQSSASVPSFVGARFQGVVSLGDGLTISPSLQLAYVHEFAPQRSELGGLINLPGSTFLVDGARPSSNAAQVKAGTEFAIGPRSTLFATFDGEFSGQSQFYGGKGGFRYVW